MKNLLVLLLITPLLFAVDPEAKYSLFDLNDWLFSYRGDYGPATETHFDQPKRIAVDGMGNVYFSETKTGIWKVSADGTVIPLSGLPSREPPSGDGGPSIIALFDTFVGLASDAVGNVYVSPAPNPGVFDPLATIRRISKEGIVSSIPTEARGEGLAINRDGNLYASNAGWLWKIAPDGTTTVIAGDGVCDSTGDGGPAVDAQICTRDVAVGPDGSVYIAEPSSNRVRKISTDGIINTVAGGKQGTGGDGGPATDAELSSPRGIDLDAAGNLYIADFVADRIRMVDTTGIIHTIAGRGRSSPHSYLGDGGPATEAFLSGPSSVAVAPSGEIYLLDSSNVRIRRIDTQGVITTVAGCSLQARPGCAGDGGHVSLAQFSVPRGMSRDLAGNLYVADEQNHRIRRISRDGIVTTFAGNGESGFTGDNGPATDARLSYPADVAFDLSGNLYVADQANHCIRRITPGGHIDTVAGTGVAGAGGDGGPATQAQLYNPEGVAFDKAGNLHISDRGNFKIRRVSPDGIISTIAGTGEAGTGGDGGPATAAQFMATRGITVDDAGNVYVADSLAHNVRRISPDGIITKFAGAQWTGRFCAPVDGIPATESCLNTPLDVAMDTDGNLLIADTNNNRIRLVTPDGVIHTLVVGDPPVGGLFSQPRGLCLGPSGRVDIATAGILWAALPSGTPAPEKPPYIDTTGVRNAASFVYGAMSPGQLISVFGQRLGPEQPMWGLTESIGGVRLLVNSVPAILLYVSSTQINAVVPFSAKPGTVATLTVERDGRLTSNGFRHPVLAAFPGIFRTNHPTAYVLNQDYAPNTVNDPASPGEVIMLWATGFGQTNPPGRDGEINADPLPRPVLPVTATIGGVPAEVTYAGGAPGLVAGTSQVNVRIPGNAVRAQDGATTIELLADSTPSRSGIVIYVK